jgi:hypothetical protein
MKAKLGLAILLLFGAASAHALACVHCTCTTSCTNPCVFPGQPLTTCGAWGVCSGRTSCGTDPCATPPQGSDSLFALAECPADAPADEVAIPSE